MAADQVFDCDSDHPFPSPFPTRVRMLGDIYRHENFIDYVRERSRQAKYPGASDYGNANER